MLKDLLLKNKVSLYRVFVESSGKFEIFLQYGKLKITIRDSDEDKVIYNKTFEKSTSAVVESFKFSKGSEDYDFLRYARIKIEALEESYFSFGVISNENPQERGSGIKFGVPEFVFLEKSKPKCVSGTIDKKKEEFLISFSHSEK